MKKVKDYNFTEKSYLQKIKFNSQKSSDINFVENYNKEYVEKILNEYRGLRAKKIIFGLLQNLNNGQKSGIGLKNSGVILEKLLIEFFHDKINLEKKDFEKWEANKIDFFFGNTGIQLFSGNKDNTKMNELFSIRNRINSGDNFYYKREESDGIYKIPIKNREVPNNVALFSISDSLIQKLVIGNNFFETINNFSLEDFLELYKSLEIIKNSFVQIQNKINFLMKEPERLTELKDNERYSIKYDKKLEELYEKEIKKFMNNEISNFPKENNTDSNIIFFYNKKDNIIIFEIYSTSNKNEQNKSSLIYEYKFFICEKKKRNNNFGKKILLKSFDKKPDKNEIQNKKNYQIKLKKIINIYNQILSKIKKNIGRISFNRDDIEKKYIDDFILKLNNGDENYSYIILFLKKILSKEKKIEFEERFLTLTQSNEKLINEKKNIFWLENFIKDIEDFLDGKKIDIENIGKNLFYNKQKILKDPIIQKFNILNNVFILKKEYGYIIKTISNICDKISLEKVSSSLQKLFFVDSKKFNSGKNFVNSIIKKLYKKIEQNNYKLENNELKLSNKEKRFLKKESIEIEKLIGRLKIFLNKALEIRNNIKKIDFENLKNIKISEDRFIFNKKFLYNTIIGLVFNGENLEIKKSSQEKIENKLSTFFEEDDFNIKSFINLLELLEDKTITEGDKEKIKEIIEKKLIFLKEKLKQEKMKIEEYNKKIGKDYKNYFELFGYIEKILLQIFPKKIIKQYELLIGKFLKDFTSYNIKNIDFKLGELIQKIGLESSKGFYLKSTLLDEYELILDEIEKLKPKEDGKNNESIEDIENQIKVLEEKNNRLKEIENILKK